MGVIRKKAAAVRRAMSEDMQRVLSRKKGAQTVQPGNSTPPSIGADALNRLAEKTRSRLKNKKPR